VSPVPVEWPVAVFRDGEQLGLIHLTEDVRLQVDFLDAGEQAKVEELIRQSGLEESGSPEGTDRRYLGGRALSRLQSAGYQLRFTVVDDRPVWLEPGEDNPRI
jgi:hypothetical protein